MTNGIVDSTLMNPFPRNSNFVKVFAMKTPQIMDNTVDKVACQVVNHITRHVELVVKML